MASPFQPRFASSLLVAVLGAWCVLAPTGIRAADTLVATLPGEFSVDNKGSANYSIPLAIPPGRQGVQPKLALNYSSGGGNGPLGVGVSLSTGFPQAITRGRTILARDGATRGINFDDTNIAINLRDKFYLDGKRLICVAGTYGEAGSTYRTEVDTFVKIDAIGAGTAIDTFVVTEKSGTKMTFGKYDGKTDGYQQGGSVSDATVCAYAYALKRVEDPLGNYCDFFYSESASTGEYLLLRISYTGMSSPVVAPECEIALTYVARTDVTSAYMVNRQFNRTKRLSSIDTKAPVGGSLTTVGTYVLNYENVAPNGRSRLTSVSPSFYDSASAQMLAAPATSLGWSAGPGAVSSQSWNFPAETDPSRTTRCVSGDFNGDGRDEFLDARNGLVVLPANGTGQTSTVWMSSANLAVAGMSGGPGSVFALDIDGDGKKDLLIVDGDSKNIYAVRSTGTAFVGLVGGGPSPTWVCSTDVMLRDFDASTYVFRTRDGGGASARLSTGDFTGDGRDDFVVHGYDGYLYLLRSTGSGFAAFRKSTSAVSSKCWADPAYLKGATVIPAAVAKSYSITPMPMDLNGDGITDYAFIERTDSGNGSGGDSTLKGDSYGAQKQLYAVFTQPNGDFSSPTAIGPPQTAMARTGNFPIIMTREDAQYAVFPGDYNGDGLPDFLICQSGLRAPPSAPSARWILMLNRGMSATRGQQWEGIFGAIPNTVTVGSATVPTVYAQISAGAWAMNGLAAPLSGSTPDAILSLFLTVSAGGGSNMFATDMNGDGLTDFVWYAYECAAGSRGWYVIYSDGKGGFSNPAKLGGPGTIWDGLAPVPAGYNVPTNFTDWSVSGSGDFNGDGLPELSFRYLSNGCGQDGLTRIAPTGGTFADLALSITNGLGSKTEIAYKPAKDDSVYTPGAPVAYPIRELRSSAPVVAEVWKDSGSSVASDPAHFSYQYSGNRLDLSGRGALGFHSFVTIDRQTSIFKYQFLAQSFPMTGLTAREQTYRYWETGTAPNDSVNFRLINSHDNTVVFDEVVNPAAGNAPWGTVYPFISKAVESRWEDGPDRHFPTSGGGEWAKAGSPESKSELLFSKALPPGAHITVTATSLFDNQSSIQTALPGTYKAGDRTTDWSADGTNTVGGSVDYAIFHALFGAAGFRQITYGNLTKLATDYGDNFTETVDTAYHPPATVGNFTGLIKSVATTVGAPAPYNTAADTNAPIKRYTYWKNGGTQTPLVETEVIDADRDEAATGPLDLTTTSIRDTRGRVKETQITGYVDSTAPTTSTTLTLSKVTRFNDRFDLPEVVEDAYGHATTTDYHPSLGIPKSVTEVNGATAETDFDALGRATQTRDLNLALQTDTAFAWTSATASDWTKTQTVAPPAGVGGLTLASVYAVRTTVTSRAVSGVSLRQPVTAYFDRLGRTIRTVKEGFAAQKAVTDTVFNVLGQAVATSLPYNPADTATGPFWAKTVYDVLGRVYTVTAPNGTVTQNTYIGRVTQVSVDAPLLGGVDPAAQINTTYVDAKGRTIKVWNADNVPATLDAKTGSSTEASVEYKLDGFGRMRATVLRGNSAGTAITVSAKYDTLGRQTELSDPDKGLWKYTNNALGQVLQQEDARHNITVSTFDPLGRPLSRTTTEPAGGPQETANWYYYDTAAVIAARPAMHLAPLGTQGWIGALHREESSVTGAPGYPAKPTSTLHYFDAHGRPSINLTTIDGKWFYTCTDYDAAGRVGSVRNFWRPPLHEAPGDQPYVWQDFGYSYTYTTDSYLMEMRDSTGQVWWEADTAAGYDHLDRPVLVRKGHGHWTKRTYRPEDGVLAAINTGPTAGSGAIQSARYYSDGLGNLVSRADDIRGLSESFGYDSLNRLTKRNGATIVAYAINGNVSTKLDVNGGPSGDYAYTGSQPHAATSAFGYTMSYDDNGNLITRTNGAGSESWATRWAGFDKPRWLAKTAYGATTGSEFIYNANRSRVAQMEFDSVNGSGTTATPGHYTRKRLYAWGATGEIDYKNLSGAGATPNWQLDTIRLYVPGPEGVIGAMEFAPNGPVEKTKRPLVYHYDHLGSVDTVTVLADRTTHVALDDTGKQSRHSFDPWGQRRDPDDWSGQPVNTTAGGHADVTPRGFTGHEMMDSLGLVNMNGRIYDGLLGRFLSADLMVSNPSSLQSFNRYSYCGNNPLTTTDPSGFESVIDERTRRRQAEEEVNGSSIRDRIVRNTSSNASTSADQASTNAANNAETVKPPAPERAAEAAPVVGQTTPEIASDTPAAKDGEQQEKVTKPDPKTPADSDNVLELPAIWESGGMIYAYDPVTGQTSVIGEKGMQDMTLTIAPLFPCAVPPFVKSAVGAVTGWIGAKVAGVLGRAAETVLPDGMGIGIVQNGRVISADLTVATSHQALAAQSGVLGADGTLTGGAQAITWVVEKGTIRTVSSINFPSQTGAVTEEAVKQFLQALAKTNGGGG